MSAKALAATHLIDLERYASRVAEAGLVGEPPGVQQLVRLHRAHIDTFPFETLSGRLGEPVCREVENMESKMLAGRGGCSAERMGLFAAVLDRLGYDVRVVPVRFAHDPGPWVDSDHDVLRVSVDGKAWLCDVGHGAGPREPLPWQDGEWRAQDGWSFRLVGVPHGLRLMERWAGQETELYTVPNDAASAADTRSGWSIRATSAESDASRAQPPAQPSTQPLAPPPSPPMALALRTAKELRQLLGRQYTRVHANGTATQVHNVDDDLLSEILDEEFALSLSFEQKQLLFGSTS